MEEKTILKRSSKGLQVQIIALGVVSLLLAVFTTWLTSILFSWTPNQGRVLIALIWILFIGAWGFSALKLWKDWSIKRYEIAKDALIVHAKAGKWGSSQTIYRYESIISLKMTQGFLGKRYDFGDVHISIPKLDGEVIMNDIDHPLEQLQEVQKRIGERITGQDTLIT